MAPAVPAIAAGNPTPKQLQAPSWMKGSDSNGHVAAASQNGAYRASGRTKSDPPPPSWMTEPPKPRADQDASYYWQLYLEKLNEAPSGRYQRQIRFINIGASIAVFTGAVFGVLGIDTIEHFALTVQSAVFALVLISYESKTQAPASYADFTNTSLQ
jgi:hypothetical protein